MHSIDVNLIDGNQCQENLANRDQSLLSLFNERTICAKSDIDQCAVSKMIYLYTIGPSISANQFRVMGGFILHPVTSMLVRDFCQMRTILLAV